MVQVTKNMHIPKVLWTSYLVSCVGFLILVLPYLIGPKYSPGTNTSDNNSREGLGIFYWDIDANHKVIKFLSL